MKLTPLNIVLACLVAWWIGEWANDEMAFSGWLFALFLVFVLLSDLVFRVLIKDLRKLWMGEIGFVLLTGILVILIKIL